MAGKLRGVEHSAPSKKAPKKSLNDRRKLCQVPRGKSTISRMYREERRGEVGTLCATKFEMECGMALEATLTRVCSCSLFGHRYLGNP
jgi:hypothetical protein